jgi:hypothetical protein
MFSNLGLVFWRALALVVLANIVSCQTPTTKTYDPSPFNFIGTIDECVSAVIPNAPYS